MSVAFTFGSLGDIIALTGLINELIEVLDDSRGSVKDYSGVVLRLRIQLNTVNRVGELFGGPARNQKEAEIQADVRQVLQQIRDCIDDFKAKIAKFSPSLESGGSGNKLKDVLKKVSWRLDKKEIEAFEKNLVVHTGLLDLHLGATAMYVSSEESYSLLFPLHANSNKTGTKSSRAETNFPNK